jgi:hypothetical protein
MRSERYLPSMASRTIRSAAWLESSVVWPGLWALLRCSAKAALMNGPISGPNGYPQTEQRLRLPSVIKYGAVLFFDRPVASPICFIRAASLRSCAACFLGSLFFFCIMAPSYAVRTGVQALWKSNGTTTQIGITYFKHCAIVNTSRISRGCKLLSRSRLLRELTRPSPRRPLFSSDGAV